MAAADAGTAAAASTTDRGGDDVDPLPGVGGGGGREVEGDSACSTPFVSAPSSPARDASSSFPYHGACFFSAPTSPTRGGGAGGGMGIGMGLDFDFDFSSRFPSPSAAAMSSADELFHNGQIRPVPRLSALLLNPEPPLPSMAMESAEASSGGERERGRVRGGSGRPSHHRKSRSLSPFSRAAHWRSRSPATPAPEPEEEEESAEPAPLATPAASRSSSSSSSASSSSSSSSRGSSSRRWGFIKDLLLNRSKSDGGKPTTTSINNLHQTTSPAAPQKRSPSPSPSPSPAPAAEVARKGTRRRRTAHERLYEARRAEAEEMRRRTYLPYRQGGLLLFGCIGLGGTTHRSGAAAVHGLARGLNTAAAVSSRS